MIFRPRMRLSIRVFNSILDDLEFAQTKGADKAAYRVELLNKKMKTLVHSSKLVSSSEIRECLSILRRSESSPKQLAIALKKIQKSLLQQQRSLQTLLRKWG